MSSPRSGVGRRKRGDEKGAIVSRGNLGIRQLTSFGSCSEKLKNPKNITLVIISDVISLDNSKDVLIGRADAGRTRVGRRSPIAYQSER